MPVRLILVPYDSGHREWRMGRGPAWLLRHGLASGLRALGNEVRAEFVELESRTPTEIASSFELWRRVARRTRDATEAGEFPVIVSGNCGATIGAIAGTDHPMGLAWFDAHGDFNTPETTESGFLDGMALAVATGRCWRSMAAGIHGFHPVPVANVIHVGARSLDPEEETQLADSGIRLVDASAARRGGVAALDDALASLGRLPRAHVHVDLDVLDPEEVGRANEFATDGGLSVATVVGMIERLRAHVPLSGATLSSFDPEADHRPGLFEAVAAILEALAR